MNTSPVMLMQTNQENQRGLELGTWNKYVSARAAFSNIAITYEEDEEEEGEEEEEEEDEHADAGVFFAGTTPMSWKPSSGWYAFISSVIERISPFKSLSCCEVCSSNSAAFCRAPNV